jgi:4-amino-4-deoxy-L-arabinose transferase-like glycosyltransferase
MDQKRSLFFILVLAVAVNYANIGGLDVYALDEAKNAEAAREMLETGNWVVPHFNYELRTDKPPLHYYFMMAGYKLFGVNPFGARFFSSLMGVMTILLVYLFSIKNFGQRTGVFAALVLIASLHFSLQMHMSVPDPYLIFFLTWAFFSFYEAYKTGSRWQLLAFYFAIGCGLLIKGPVALGLAGLTALLFLLAKKDLKWPTIWRLQPFGGVILSLLIALPWYYQVHVQTAGKWTNEFFYKHNIDRFADPMEGHDGIFLLTFGYVFILGMLTFLPFVFQSVKHAYKVRKQHDALFFTLIATFVVVGFFSVSSTKLPNYTVPSYPVLAIILGYYLEKLDRNWFTHLGNRIGLILYAILLIAFPVGIYFGLDADKSLSHLSNLSYYFIILSAVGLSVFWFMKKRAMTSMLLSIMAGWLVITVLFFHLLYPKIDAESPVSKTLPTMNTEASIIAYQRLNAAFVFELKKEIKRYAKLEEIKKAIDTTPSGYVISRTEYREELEKIPGLVYHTEARDTFENPTTLIMKWGNP